MALYRDPMAPLLEGQVLRMLRAGVMRLTQRELSTRSGLRMEHIGLAENGQRWLKPHEVAQVFEAFAVLASEVAQERVERTKP